MKNNKVKLRTIIIVIVIILAVYVFTGMDIMTYNVIKMIRSNVSPKTINDFLDSLLDGVGPIWTRFGA